MTRRLVMLLVAVMALMVLALPAMAQTDGGEVTEVVFDLAWVGAVIAFFLPLVTSLVKRQSWSDQLKRIIAVVTAAIAGVVNTGVQAGWVFDSAGEFISLTLFSITQVYVAAAVIYQNFWSGTSTETRLAEVGS